MISSLTRTKPRRWGWKSQHGGDTTEALVILPMHGPDPPPGLPGPILSLPSSAWSPARTLADSGCISRLGLHKVHYLRLAVRPGTRSTSSTYRPPPICNPLGLHHCDNLSTVSPYVHHGESKNHHISALHRHCWSWFEWFECGDIMCCRWPPGHCTRSRSGVGRGRRIHDISTSKPLIVA